MLGGARPDLPGWGAFTGAPSGLNPRPFRIFQSQLQFACKGVNGRAAALPGAIGLEPEVADAAAPRRDDAANRAVVAAIGVILVQPADDIRRDANEGAQRRRRLDAVLAAAPGGAEDHRDLLEVVDEEPLTFLAEVRRFLRTAERVAGKQLLQFLRERRLRHTATADAEQFDLAVQ